MTEKIKELITECETTYVERRVPEELEEEAQALIDARLISKGYNPREI